MFDPERLLGQMLGQGMGLGGHKRGKPKKRRHHYSSGSMINKAQVGVGLLGIAIAAWEHYSSQQKANAGAGAPAAAPPPPPPTAGAGAASVAASPPPPPPAARPPAATGAAPALSHPSPGDAEHLLRTMVAAANADGQVDAAEREAILRQAGEQGADAEALAWLQQELAAPLSVESLVDATRGGLREATYAAAVAALEVDTDAERRWLQRLAEGLRLTESERDAVERAVAASREE